MDQPDRNPPSSESPSSDTDRILKWVFLSAGIVILVALIAIAVPYWRLAQRVDRQLAAGPFLHTYSFYAEPAAIAVGDQESAQDLVAALRRGGLRESSGDEPQTFSATEDGVIVRTSTPVRVNFQNNQVRSISDLTTNRRLTQFDLPPQLITNLSDEGRARRIIIRYADLPPVLVDAVVSIEDKRFFTHDGVDVLRIAKAFYVDVKQRRKEQGASTITMQLARNLWLEARKTLDA